MWLNRAIPTCNCSRVVMTKKSLLTFSANLSFRKRKKSHWDMWVYLLLFIKIPTHNQQHCSSGSGWDNLLHVHILWLSVIEYRTVQCTYPLHDRTDYFNEGFFFGRSIWSMFVHLHELPMGVHNDVSCNNGILHNRITDYGKNIFACNCKKNCQQHFNVHIAPYSVILAWKLEVAG
jgi:hypothetical protein